MTFAIRGGFQCESTAPAHEKVEQAKSKHTAHSKPAARTKPTAGYAGTTDGRSLLPAIDEVRAELRKIDNLPRATRGLPRGSESYRDQEASLSSALYDLRLVAAESGTDFGDVSEAVMGGTNYTAGTTHLYFQMVGDHRLTIAAKKLDGVNVAWRSARKESQDSEILQRILSSV